MKVSCIVLTASKNSPMDGYWFTSTLFAVEPREDAETNPRMYGRQLASCLKVQLGERGRVVPRSSLAMGRSGWRPNYVLQRTRVAIPPGTSYVSTYLRDAAPLHTALGPR